MFLSILAAARVAVADGSWCDGFTPYFKTDEIFNSPNVEECSTQSDVFCLAPVPSE
jgi:hypothetical protein